ncbi:MAG: class I SAM-dependent methyltransferase [bacterium]
MSSCPLCSHDQHNNFPISYTFHEKKFSARKCRHCSFIFLDPRPTTDDLKLLYSDEYFLFDGADCGAHSSSDYETAARNGSMKFPEILGWIRKYKPSGDFFEIGCGMGYFLDYVRDAGYTVSGIEYAMLGTTICRKNFQLDVAQTSFEEYPIQEQRFDVVFMGDVLEHFIDPLPMAKKAYLLLRPGGILAAEVPSMFNTLVGRLAAAGLRLLGRTKQMPMPPYHVNEFTPRTLKEMVQRAGFRNVEIIQRIKSPVSITLRGNIVEKAIKLLLQYPNYLITKTLKRFGDRLLVIGMK